MSLAHAKRYVRETQALTDVDLLEQKDRILSGQVPILSSNLTCGVAVNVAISHTCKTNAKTGEGASPLCAVACYAKAGRMGMRSAVVKAQAVYELINEQPLEWLAARIHADYARHAVRLKGRLRWNAAGDLFPREVALINYMIEHAEYFPFIERHYLYTKRPSLLNQFVHRPDKLAAFVSVDASNLRIAQLVQWPWTQAAYMVTSATEVVPDTLPARTPHDYIPVTVEFPDHGLKHELPVTDRTCAKLRPLNDGGVPMKRACATCTLCSQDPRLVFESGRMVA